MRKSEKGSLVRECPCVTHRSRLNIFKKIVDKEFFPSMMYSNGWKGEEKRNINHRQMMNYDENGER